MALLTRSICWRHEDGEAASIAALTSAIRPWAKELATTNCEIYESTDFKTGVQVDMLVEWSPLLKSCLTLDPRGGIFAQGLMETALTTAMEQQHISVVDTKPTGKTIQAYVSVIEKGRVGRAEKRKRANAAPIFINMIRQRGN